MKKFGLTLLIVLVALIGFFICKMLWSMVEYTQIPGQIKLCDLTTTNTRVSFSFSKADHLHLVLGISNQVPQFQNGAMNLYKGTTLVRRFEFRTNDIQRSSWLDSRGLTGYILNWGTSNGAPNLDFYLVPNQTNIVTLEFDRLPAENASIWLSYLQFAKDVRAEKRHR